MTQIKFADGATVDAVLISGASRHWQGASRDVLSVQFAEDAVTFDQLQTVFSPENCASLVIGEGALYEHYTLRVSLALRPVTVQPATADTPETTETRWVVEMAQQTYTERQMAEQAAQVAGLQADMDKLIPPVDPSNIDSLRAAKQSQNKAALADWLAAHPLTWTDGNVYGTTKEDQDEMDLNLAQYKLAVSAGQDAPLEWHTQKKRCHSFTLEEYTALSLAIAAYVYPYRRYQETIKEAIYAAESKEELDAIEIDYSSVGAAA